MADAAGSRRPLILVILRPMELASIAAYPLHHHPSVDLYVTDHVYRVISQVEATRPETLVVSVAALGPHPVNTVGRLRVLLPQMMITALYTEPADTIADLLAAGCHAVLIASYDDVLALLTTLTAPAIDTVTADPAPAPNLSSREREVLVGMAEGMTNVQIARLLQVSLDTVKTHARRIYATLGAHDRAHAVSIALRMNLITAESPAAALPQQRARGNQAESG